MSAPVEVLEALPPVVEWAPNLFTLHYELEGSMLEQTVPLERSR